MAEPTNTPVSRPYSAAVGESSRPQPANLADILERVLDKGIIIAGDIRVNLLDIELLTIKIRLLIVSVDKAQEMGIDWWRNDPMLTTSERGLAEENRELRERIKTLEAGDSPTAASGGTGKGSS
ncbi:hypothetical protein GCM10011492_27520 [Flexivirga endophytica]|uniref:Gas vesicle structural protein n=1 Tax=Flexivirga endophytica TaxID=1849103 RepID=A0A916T9L8_9MICO|nr:gas vesicle protein GvpJ [Flexivirga endophytica]GGB35333.1 hypothetical protein GCM10011492_27520 [Flexivirga endophytica]GHB43121.1 hypothetical protein GCM10008112_09900 [Flexivirga endophytica]